MPFAAVRLLPAACIVAFASLPAAAQSVDSRNPESVAAALRAKGLTVERVTTQKDPTYRSETGGLRFTILFWGCGQTTGCDSIEFASSYGATQIDPATVVAWNQRHPDARIFRRPAGTPVIGYSVFFRRGPMSKAEFDAKLDTGSRWPRNSARS